MRRFSRELTILVIYGHLSRASISPMMILRNTKKMKMLCRPSLLRMPLGYSNTSPQHHGEVLAHRWGTMTSPWRAKSCHD